MNELTKFLIKELLDESKTVALYGGGFKPPTKGHFTVVELALNELPDIDELKVLVGQGVRDGITQEESLAVWNIYKNYLSPKVVIEPSIAPVKSVLNYAKDNPDTKVYWILGARDGEEGDLEDIARRTKTISKYPNLEVKVITSTGGVSGTKARKAVKDNNKEQFFQSIPDIKEKEQIWNIVFPVINEVGEANLQPYKWEEIRRNSDWWTVVGFTTDSETQYVINLKTTTYIDDDLNNYKALDIDFTAKPKDKRGKPSYKIVVNKGELYKVMSTITDIIKHYVEKFKAKAISYSPSKKSSEEDFGTQRDNLYKAFISKAIPDIKFEKDKESIVAILPGIKEEITPDQVKQADTYADKQLAPVDVDLTSKHVFDRLTSRDSDVTLAQLIGFFKRLGQNKKEFFDFFKKYKEIVATDKRTNLNIPFLNMTNKAIAKTIMRKDNFMSSSPKLVFEVGEANLKPYKWKEVDVDGWVTYVEFTTESETEYSVDIATVPYFDNDLNNYKALEIEFLAKPKDAQGSSAKIIVNKGELYRVMATITDIIKYYVKKFKAKAISYSPSKKSDEEDFGSQRDNLYRAFISKAIPGVRFEKNSNFITAILPDKETLNEGRYDSITRLVVKDIMNSWKSQFDGKEGELRFEEDYELENSKGQPIDFELLAVLKLEETEDKTYIVDGGANEELDPPYLEVTFQVDPRSLPKMWSTIYNDLIDVVRHEIEHLTQSGTNVIPSKEMADDQSIRQMINWGLLPQAEYFKLEKEVDAMLQGMYLKAKKSRTPFKDVINDYFEKVGLEGEDKQDVLDLWTKRLKALNLPPIKEASDPQAGTALPYGSGFAPVKELVTATEVICDNCGWEWSIKDGGKDLYICHKCGHDNTPKKDTFGLNELAKTFVKETFEKAWNLQDGMLSLSKYMMDNGMNITPLPKIKVIKDDEENASHLLGKTAYYDPNNKSITLYTMNRHPKDVLRSFAHEMVHHEQNLEGRLNNINTTNTNEDGDLPNIEKEAYEKGNMMLRNWEDNIKNV